MLIDISVMVWKEWKELLRICKKTSFHFWYNPPETTRRIRWQRQEFTNASAIYAGNQESIQKRNTIIE
jgi:hypothetical protein